MKLLHVYVHDCILGKSHVNLHYYPIFASKGFDSFVLYLPLGRFSWIPQNVLLLTYISHLQSSYQVSNHCKMKFVLTFQKKPINCICKYKLLPLIPNIIMNSCWLYAIITKTELLFMLKIHLALSKILVHQNYNSNTGVYRLWVWFFFFYNNSINRKNSHLTFWPPTLV